MTVKELRDLLWNFRDGAEVVILVCEPYPGDYGILNTVKPIIVKEVDRRKKKRTFDKCEWNDKHSQDVVVLYI